MVQHIIPEVTFSWRTVGCTHFSPELQWNLKVIVSDITRADRVVDGFDGNTALSHREQEDVVSIIRRSSVDSKQLHATER